MSSHSQVDPLVDPLLEQMRLFWAEADEIWDEFYGHEEFGGFVSADYVEVYQALQELQGKIDTVLEWGSGLGVVTIMASRLGFQAYGIEVEPLLVERARELAECYGADAQFAVGSFIPDDYQWGTETPGNPSRTETDARDAYDELDMQLDEFDLVYAYPWPDEFGLYWDILQKHCRENSLFLCYDAREGVSLTQIETQNPQSPTN